MKKRALISVSDKKGIVPFAKALSELGYEVISTGNTAKTLLESGVNVANVSDITGFPECLDGRVKTLHPMIHAGILAVRDNKDHMTQLESLGALPIDIVVVNLYPFAETIKKPGVSLEDAIENIDIGGPSMVRAAAKNWRYITVVTDFSDYDIVINELKSKGISENTRFKLAAKAFRHTAGYDAMISRYLTSFFDDELFPESLTFTFDKAMDMRYGENPHQKGAFYKETQDVKGSLISSKKLWGKDLSYNNINDANGALDILKEFSQPCVVAVKHANPCGVGIGENICGAYINAYNADPVSIFGGIIAANRQIDEKTALEINKIFVEIVLAPSYSPAALDVLKQKKNLRILVIDDISKAHSPKTLDMKKVAGGLLVQQLDTALLGEDLKCVTRRKPTEKEMDDLLFAWKVVKHTKSNAIVLAKGNRTTGIGPGQTNRITALSLAINYAEKEALGSVMASDAFFPFDDCVKAAANAGISAIIQPGGSIRDEDSVKACDENGIAMIFTGMRHFKH